PTRRRAATSAPGRAPAAGRTARRARRRTPPRAGRRPPARRRSPPHPPGGRGARAGWARSWHGSPLRRLVHLTTRFVATVPPPSAVVGGPAVATAPRAAASAGT